MNQNRLRLKYKATIVYAVSITNDLFAKLYAKHIQIRLSSSHLSKSIENTINIANTLDKL